jgi:hypothetical protein
LPASWRTPFRVKRRDAHDKQIVSARPPTADIKPPR